MIIDTSGHRHFSVASVALLGLVVLVAGQTARKPRTPTPKGVGKGPRTVDGQPLRGISPPPLHLNRPVVGSGADREGPLNLPRRCGEVSGHSHETTTARATATSSGDGNKVITANARPITDPAGRIPALTPAKQKRVDALTGRRDRFTSPHQGSGRRVGPGGLGSPPHGQLGPPMTPAAITRRAVVPIARLRGDFTT